MISAETPLVLGSASPRRRDILESLRIPFRVVPADVAEHVRAGEPPTEYLERVVRDKLTAVAARVPSTGIAGVLVADTIVVLDEQILGKPADVNEAVHLLTRLVGRTHTVYTRYAISSGEQPAHILCARTVQSQVTLRAASAAEVRRYAESGEGLDKAGAYAAQGLGAFLVQRIEGSYANVVGLPACELVEDLLRVGLLRDFP
ncbi:MAG: nucleoside triphosphate pyrophosphatase [Pseudomonadota bacterium]|nr:MAG: septum formation protein Maf [Pseudomonadota bacterium]